MQSVKALLAAVTLASLAAGTVFLAGGAAIAEQRLGTPYPDQWREEQAPSGCPVPPGWVPYRVKQAETLAGLASLVGVEEAELRRNNCIEGELNPGETLFLPGGGLGPTSSACGPPPGWELAKLEAGEELADIARRYTIEEEALRRANCLGSTTPVDAGLRIYVPATPTVFATEVEPQATATTQAEETARPIGTVEG